MTMPTCDAPKTGFWSRLPVAPRAIVSGLLVALIAANVWPLLLMRLSVPLAAGAEALFLIVYLWWATGHGAPRSTRAARADAGRAGRFTAAQWTWGIIAAVAFAVTVNAAITVLFRLVPFPVEDFRRGYDLSFIPTLPLKLLACVVSATSAGVCEEVGFRGYMQRPIERRHGPVIAIAISSVLFAVIHLNKGFEAVPAMLGVTLGAGVLLGLIAWASGSLIPGIIGHAMMDTALFAFWWTGTLGDFTAQPISVTGVDAGFQMACAVLGGALIVVLTAIVALRRMRKAR
jgi:membrane protease YdiL (CAAX protease family)